MFPALHLLELMFGCGVLITAAWCDFATRMIPNSLPLALSGVGLAIRIEAGDWRAGLLAAAIILSLGFALWLLGAWGGGDAKLLAAAAIFVAPPEILRLLALMSLLGGALALIYLLLGRLAPIQLHWPQQILARRIQIEHRRMKRRAPLPYAIAIAGAALVTVIR